MKEFVIKNRTMCNKCKTIVTSTSMTEKDRCYCGELEVIGGNDMKTIVKHSDLGYVDMPVLSTSSILEVRSALSFPPGTFNNLEPLYLKDMEYRDIYEFLTDPPPYIDYSKRGYAVYSFVVKELVYRSLKKRCGAIKANEITYGQGK